MGVKDLWKLLEPAGRPVNLESLVGVVLAVDVSIWLNQAVKGMRDSHGNPLPEAHLVVLFNRVCKLLHYGIKPVFVFDGATPALKKHTLTERSRKRVRATQRSLNAMDKQVTKLLQTKILEQVYGKESGSVPQPTVPAAPPDLFELPPLPDNALSRSPEPNCPPHHFSAQRDHTHQVASLDIHSDDFNSLPPEVQHELLLERQQLDTHTHHDPATLPQVADDFSSYQLSKLMAQSQTTRKLEEVRKVLKSSETAVMGLGEETRIHDVETSRILSSEGAHYILVKGKDIDSQSSQDEDEDGGGWKKDEKDCSGGRKEEESDYSGGWKSKDKDELVESVNDKQLLTVKEQKIVASLNESVGGDEVMGKLCTAQSLDDSPPQSEELTPSHGTPLTEALVEQNSSAEDVKKLPRSPSEQLPSDSTPVTNQTHTPPLTDKPLRLDSGEEMNALSPAHSEHPPSVTMEMTPVINQTHAQDDGSELSPSQARPEPVNALPSSQARVSPPHTNSPRPASADEEPSQSIHLSSFYSKSQAILDASRQHSENLITASFVRKASNSPPQSESSNSEGEWKEDLLSLPPSEAQHRLRDEARELERERGRQSRAAAAVSNTMYKEAQELLRLFGLPHLVAPSEAEAQCAYLELSGQVEGTITDDNDVFLFGGRCVYRGIYSQDKDPEVYHSSDIEGRLGLSRQQLVLLAYLLGCDYTVGLEGVGIVSAMELLRDFPGEQLEPLERIRDWHREALVKPALVKQASGVLKKLSQSTLPPTFPDEAVYQAYLSPEVDTSSEQFEWGRPDLDLLRQFAHDKMSWDQAKVDSLLVPLLRRINSSRQQRTITHYLHTPLEQAESQRRRGIKSKRIRNVVARLTHEGGDKPASGSKRKRTASPSKPSKQPRLSQKTRHTKVKPCQPPPVTAISASSSDSD